MRLIAAHAMQHRLEQRLLDAIDHHVIDAARPLAVEVLEIPLYGPAHDTRHFIVVHHAASPSMYCRRRPRAESSAKNSFTAASCSAQVCNWFMPWRNAADPANPLVYQEMCLRATRTPVCSP